MHTYWGLKSATIKLILAGLLTLFVLGLSLLWILPNHPLISIVLSGGLILLTASSFWVVYIKHRTPISSAPNTNQASLSLSTYRLIILLLMFSLVEMILASFGTEITQFTTNSTLVNLNRLTLLAFLMIILLTGISSGFLTAQVDPEPEQLLIFFIPTGTCLDFDPQHSFSLYYPKKKNTPSYFSAFGACFSLT